MMLAVKYAIGLALLVGVLLAAQFEPTWRSLVAVDLVWFAGALLAMTASRWLGALLTSRLGRVHGIRLSVARLFQISCISTLYGLALPGSLSGGVVRWYRIGKLQRSHSTAAALIVFERLSGTAVLAVLGVIGWLLDARAPTAPGFVWVFVAAAVVFLSATLGSISHLSDRLSAWLSARRASGIFERLRASSARALEAATRHRDLSVVLWTVSLSAAVHLTATGGLYLMATALGLNLSYATMLWLRACTFVITAAPLTPAGLGVREFSTLLLLGLIGVDADQAVALSLLQSAAILFFAALGGLFESRDHLLEHRSRSVTYTGAEPRARSTEV